MRSLTWILGTLVALVLTFVAVGMILPRNVSVAR